MCCKSVCFLFFFLLVVNMKAALLDMLDFGPLKQRNQKKTTTTKNTSETLNPCCLKFTLLPTANVFRLKPSAMQNFLLLLVVVPALPRHCCPHMWVYVSKRDADLKGPVLFGKCVISAKAVCTCTAVHLN